MTSFLQKRSILVQTIITLAWFSIFFFLNRYLPGKVEFHNLHTFIDEWFPFQPEWILIYFFTLFLPFVPAMMIKNKHYYAYAAMYFIYMLLIGYIVFLVYPVQVIRVQAPINGFLSWGIKINHLLDNPINCFPSFHVAAASAIAFIIYPVSRRDGIILHILSFLIALSVLYVKAHVFLDVIAGYALAIAFGFFYFTPNVKKLMEREHSKEQILRSRHGLVWIGVVYVTLLSAIYLFYLADMKWHLTPPYPKW